MNRLRFPIGNEYHDFKAYREMRQRLVKKLWEKNKKPNVDGQISRSSKKSQNNRQRLIRRKKAKALAKTCAKMKDSVQ
jgi:hypothetical protein